MEGWKTESSEHATIYHPGDDSPGDEERYVAECLDLAVVTQGCTLDETVRNLREAILLHLEGENLEEMGLVSTQTEGSVGSY